MTLGSPTDPIHTLCAVMTVVTMLVPTEAAAQSTRAHSRVRSEDPLIAKLIADAPALSATFRDLVTAIDTTNGIVYVESGRCGRGARACLVLSVDVVEAARPSSGPSATSSTTRWRSCVTLRSPRVRRCSSTSSAGHRSAQIGSRRKAPFRRDTGLKTK